MSIDMETPTATAAAAPSAEAIASVTALYNDMQSKARPLVDKFEERYAAWKQTWANSDAQGEEFAKVTSLGVKILPLVVYKLCSASEMKAVKLYNAIEKDVNFKSQSPTAIIESNYKRNQDFAEFSAGWEIFKANCQSNNSQDYTVCGDYMDLVDMGMGIVPHTMLAYYDDFGGWWDLLLCELVSGHKSGAWVMFRLDIHRRWIEWFESEKGEADAPYKLVGEAARVERYMRAGGMGRDYVELADE